MKPEQAKKELEQWRAEIADDESLSGEVLAGLKKLPAKLRRIALGVAGQDPDGKLHAQDYCREIDGLSDAERKRVFTAVTGPLAKDIELGWQALKRTGCRDVESFTVYRAPNSPERTLHTRAEWLTRIVEVTTMFRFDVLTPMWLAAWAPYIMPRYYAQEREIGLLCAAVIDKGGKRGDEVFDILCQCARSEHEVGAMGRHVTLGLLAASRKEGWDLIEGMLLAAKRQEGLRQAILDALHTAHPEAFKQLLRTIAKENLVRFAAVVQACDKWFAMLWAAQKSNPLATVIDRVIDYLDSAKARKAALGGDVPEDAFLALWALAFEDIETSIAPAQKLLKHDDVEMRFVAALHLTYVNHPLANKARLTALGDDDLRVALAAMSGIDDSHWGVLPVEGKGAFEAMVALTERLPKKPQKLKPLVWPWTDWTASKKSTSAFLVKACGRDVAKLMPYLKDIDSWKRYSLCDDIADLKKWNAAEQELMLQFVSDASPDVRQKAFDALLKKGVPEREVERLEPLLKRKSADTRNGVVSLLFAMSDDVAFGAASRLLAAKNAPQRLAGLELFRQLTEAKRKADDCRRVVTEWQSKAKKPTKDEKLQLAAILDEASEVVTLENALGLMDPAGRSPKAKPKAKKIETVTQAAIDILKSLDSLVHKHREETVTCEHYGGQKEDRPLGEAHWSFPGPHWNRPIAGQLDRLPLREVWEEWLANRPKKLCDKDGCELLRAAVLVETMEDEREEVWEWLSDDKTRKPVTTILLGSKKPPRLRYERIVLELLRWLVYMNRDPKHIDLALDVVESTLASLPASVLAATQVPTDDEGDVHPDFRNLDLFKHWLWRLHSAAGCPDVELTKAQQKRYWGLLRFIDEPAPGATHFRPEIGDLSLAYRWGCATLDDIAEHLLGPRVSANPYDDDFESLSYLTDRSRNGGEREFLAIPEVRDLLQRCIDRAVELEFNRGEKPTVSTKAVVGIGNVGGADMLVRLMCALGKKGFKVTSHYSYASKSKDATLTQLVTSTWPAEGDTAASFKKAMQAAIKAGDITEDLLVQLAFLAPQWVAFLEPALGWSGLSEAIYWFLAHMNYVYGLDDTFADDSDYDEDADNVDDDAPKRLSRWERIIRERTDLTSSERYDGAIDVSWFHRAYAALGKKRWESLAGSARLAATAAQGKRAKLIADVLLGAVPKKELVTGITKKHLKENVRLLGLLPLAKGAKAEADLADRYEVMQAYRKYANGLSSMTKPEAIRAAEIGMHNLAMTAGYADPMRLQWAMEASSTADLAAGPVVVKKGDVSYTLEIDEQAAPELTIRRKDKVLKSLPKDVKKNAKFTALRERGKHLKQQAARVKQSLEAAMCRGDSFTGAELMQLADHALLWPQLSRLVLIGEGILGYPDKRGKALRDHAGKLEPVRKKELFRIAHPHDLFKNKDWAKWQRECFATERLQPFKQVFRELYVVTAQEKKDKQFSRRYAGQQVQDRQSRALWGRRDWSSDEYGSVFKAFPAAGISAEVSFDFGVTTPLEYEGLTVENVHFSTIEDLKPIPITKVAPQLFSEVMRDMDLVVSVAHTGEVDPEASASTVEMRASLLRETCQLFGLKNVKVKPKDSRVFIKGELGEYSIHLGSGVVHRMPGGSVCIVPVHAQHRGRLFLPFADDDPRTAEIVAKTLLLARDGEIDDPIILEQLRAMA